jgi:hypothetical protein
LFSPKYAVSAVKTAFRFVLASDCFDFAWNLRKFGMAIAEDADDRHDDHQLDEGEAFPVSQHAQHWDLLYDRV